MRAAIRTIALVAAMAGAAGIAVQFAVAHGKEGSSLGALWELARYYTYWANFSVLVVMLALTFAPGSRLTGPRVALTITSSMVLVGLIYYLAIYDPNNTFPLPQKISEHLLHFVVPVAVLSIFLLRPHGALGWRHVWWGVVPVFVYGCYVLARGGLTGSWPYWFTDVPKLGWWGTIRNYVALHVAFAVSTFVFIALDRVLARLGPSGR